MAIIGIDLGTSNSAAAVLRGGRPVIIPSAEGISIGGKAFPSYVALTADGQVLVGEPARRQASANPEGTASAFKRKMGKRENYRLRDKDYSPEQLSAFLLQKIKRDAEAFLGEPVEKAVVTVPAYFDDNQRAATKDACRIAGLEVVRLVNEPTAASLAYGLDRLEQELRIVVIDLGGGTLDVTIMEFGKGVFEVKSTSGDTQLGGTDMNQRIYEHLAERFQMSTGVDVRNDPKAAARLIEAAENAKIELTTSVTTHLSLPYLAAVNGEPRHLEMDLNRTELERLVRPVIDRCKGPVEQALHDAGSPRRTWIASCSSAGRRACRWCAPISRSCSGARPRWAWTRWNAWPPAPRSRPACSAGEVSGIVLVDVTPLTLGVETLGGIATPLIARNTPVPVKRTETFTTAADMQTSVTIHVFQGERPMSGDNTSLGEFNLDGLPPAPRGIPKIEVTFDIDSNGILSVAAKDTASGKSQSISITGSTRLSEDDKKRMVEDAAKYADADKKRREDAEKLNAADASCYEAEKLLANFSDKMTDELKKRIETALRETKEALFKKDVPLATTRAEALKKVLQEAGAVLYAQTGQAPKGGPYKETRWEGPEPPPNVGTPTGEARASGAGPRGKVVDAEYKENK